MGRRVKPTILVWLTVFLGVVLALSVTGVGGWAAIAVVAGTLVLAIPLSRERFRLERNLVRAIWRTLQVRRRSW